MKALITAGGHGTRLRPITFTLNKHLVPVANKPLIFYALEKISKCNIKDVGININPGDTSIQKIVGDGSKWNLRITYLEQKGGPKGLSHIILNAKPFLGESDFIFYLGDNIVLGEINHLVDAFYAEKANCLLALSKVRDPQRFGVPELNENGDIIGIVEKPQNPKSEYAVTGIYIYDKSIMKAVESISPSARGELEISDAHQYLLDNNYKVKYKEITGWWKDTGKPEDLLEGNQLLLNNIQSNNKAEKISEDSKLQGNIIIGENTKILEKSFLRGPIIIGSDCEIKNSYIGPFTSIGNNVKIEKAEVEHSIVFDEAEISCRKRIIDSLIGHKAVIKDSEDSLPSGHKLLVGDNSFIEI
jgi:glucose-1-phosphate thymidylyltransferase